VAPVYITRLQCYRIDLTLFMWGQRSEVSQRPDAFFSVIVASFGNHNWNILYRILFILNFLFKKTFWHYVTRCYLVSVMIYRKAWSCCLLHAAGAFSSVIDWDDALWSTYEYSRQYPMSADEFQPIPMTPGNNLLVALVLISCLILSTDSKGNQRRWPWSWPVYTYIHHWLH